MIIRRRMRIQESREGLSHHNLHSEGGAKILALISWRSWSRAVKLAGCRNELSEVVEEEAAAAAEAKRKREEAVAAEEAEFQKMKEERARKEKELEEEKAKKR